MLILKGMCRTMQLLRVVTRKQTLFFMKTITIDFPGGSLFDIHEQYKGVNGFYFQSWYETEAFALEKIPAGKWEVRLEPMPDSFNKTWEEQQKTLPDLIYEVPPVAVLAFAIMEHWRNTGERAFESCYVRTSSLDSGGYRVLVGDFGAGGLDVDDCWGDDRDSRLGVSAARKFGPRNLEALEPSEALTLESLSARIEKIENWAKGYPTHE